MVNEDIEEVAALIAQVMTEREPMHLHTRATFEECYRNFGKPAAEKCVKHDLSFVCVDTSLPQPNEIVGYRLCSTLCFREIDENQDFNFAVALNAHFDECERRYLKMHENTDLNDHFKFNFLGVKSGYESRGIATKLTEVALNNAKIKGFKFALAMTSSSKVQHIFGSKLRMKPLFSCPYDKIEFKGVKFLKGITNAPAYVAFQVDFKHWNLEEHIVDSQFD